ncbi:MAG: YraN family protein [Candidatus Colwellbacteria bacterium]
MKTEKFKLGQLGEEFACKFLKKKGYKIIERNYWKPWGELDIVAVSPEKILVLIEVKTVKGPQPMITAEDQITRAKLIKFRRAAELYANGSKLLSNKGWRIDLVAVTIDDGEFDLKHYENI